MPLEKEIFDKIVGYNKSWARISPDNRDVDNDSYWHDHSVNSYFCVTVGAHTKDQMNQI